MRELWSCGIYSMNSETSTLADVDENGDIFQVLSFFADITDRKRAEMLQNEKLYLQEVLKSELNFGEIIGTSAAMKAVFKNIELVAATDSTVLLLGETGTGKELIARTIHNSRRRNGHVLIKVNCGALPTGLVERELFGHEKGAFTGASAQNSPSRYHHYGNVARTFPCLPAISLKNLATEWASILTGLIPTGWND